MKLEIEALDPLFFRDGRPFTMGEESYAESIFPPLPSTIRGALRSMWISDQLGVVDANRDLLVAASIGIELTYFALGVNGKPVFQVPFDLYFDENQESIPSKATPMEVINKVEIVASSCPSEVSHLFKAGSNSKTEPVNGYLLDFETMKCYLSGNSTSLFDAKRRSDFIKQEHKIGIGRDREVNTTKDGLLFRLTATRFEDSAQERLSLLLKLYTSDSMAFSLSKYTIMPLGGDRRSVIAKSSNEDFLPPLPAIQGNFVKIYLLTPALFDSWFPEISGLKLIASAIGKSISVGGWDLFKQRPKPMRRAVPAGSVFIFEADSEAHANEIAKRYHGKSLCNQLEDQKNGFGLCLIAQPFNNQNPK
jgi:CRISPR-associated protein Cmr3